MSDRSKIEWCDASWNPIRGVRGRWSCTKVSPGCHHCYSESLNVRFGGPRYVADELRLDETILTQPLRWKKPRRVFVCSMTDLFEERVPDEWIMAIFGVMARASQHTFQVLTKRVDRMREFLSEEYADGWPLECAMALLDFEREHGVGDGGPIHCKWGPNLEAKWPFPNVWVGVSVEDQQRADERIPLLLQMPAALRFVSAEPLLGPIRGIAMRQWCVGHGLSEGCCRGVDWMIVGGESGPSARPCNLAWIADIPDECAIAKVPLFVKQLGRWIAGHSEPFCVQRWLLDDGRVFVPPLIGINASHRPDDAIAFALGDPKGGDPAEWPKNLIVREWPR